jgi:Family of unknown function (DUF6519)
MKGDFSRMTFDVSKHFSRVLMQQGRVQLDADWNEQAAILLHYMQTLAKDLIGDQCGPSDNWGFEIKRLTASTDNFGIGKGRYYVDGVLCENGDINDSLPDVTYFGQPYYPLDKTTSPLPNGTLLVYLDVREHLVTSVEDDTIREVALGGPDTAVRARIVWQVKVENKMPDGVSPIPELSNTGKKLGLDEKLKTLHWTQFLEKWQPTHRGLLKARAKQDKSKEADPCITSAEASYRGVENQLYRVEIHDKGVASTKTATFKWSRDNASVLVRVALSGTELTVEVPHKLSESQWLELTNDEQELRGEPGTLVKIKKIVCEVVTLETIAEPKPVKNIPKDEKWPTKARVWESGEVNIVENTETGDINWIKLEDGIEIQFQKSTPENQYLTGDYWLIPVRVATGDVEWPGEVGQPNAIPPHGVEHHYALLATISNGTPIEARSSFPSQAK